MNRRVPAGQQWFLVEEIPECSLYMMGPPTRFFTQEWPRRGLIHPGLRREPVFFVNYFEGDFCQMWFRRSAFSRGAEYLVAKILARPIWALRILDQVEVWSRRFFESVRRFQTLPLRWLTVAALIREYQRVYQWQELSHGVGASVSWYSDVDSEQLTKGISTRLEQRLRRTTVVEPISVVFSLLSTPLTPSQAAIEEREFLTLAAAIRTRPRLRRLFQGATVTQLSAAVPKADAKIAKKLLAHCAYWRWLRYGYRGPAYSDGFFLERWQALIKSGEDPTKLLAGLTERNRDLARRQGELVRRLRLSRNERQLVRLTQRIIFIKEYRKAALYYGMYGLEPFFREVARRLGIRLEHAWAMNPWEITAALKRGSVNKRELDARLTYAISYATHQGYRMLGGRAAKRFFARLPKEHIVHEGVRELHGSCASPGSASGRVKIINVPSDMSKMRRGNILLSETTYPSLLPAMKKASAIVTNVGGLTCHAAIVSRELGIPCVVGTKIGTKVFKDGDRVEVDSTKGIVKKI